MTKLMVEHVIISDTIEANGNREVTLRTRPKIPGKTSFGFYIVNGGLNKHPELAHAWKTGVEVIGKVYLVKDERFIEVSGIRALNKREQKEKEKADMKLWKQLA